MIEDRRRPFGGIPKDEFEFLDTNENRELRLRVSFFGMSSIVTFLIVRTSTNLWLKYRV